LARQPWFQRHAVSAVSLVLAAALSISFAWQSADWLRTLRAPVAASNSAATPAVTASAPEIGQLFASRVARDQPAPDTHLQLTLLGSFVHADPQRSSAIIRREGSAAQRYRLNSEISSGVSLHSVAVDHIELMRNGRRESLRFPQHNSTTDSPPPPPQGDRADAAAQLSDRPADDLNSLHERLEALRQQLQDADSLPETVESTEQPTEDN
jgi:general secretion pathway protein C